MQAQGVDPLHDTADHVKLYKRALLEAGRTPATVARRLSVLRGTYHQFAGHADIRTTEVDFVREEDAEVAARQIQIRVTGRKSE
jgi:hypothetical protein